MERIITPIQASEYIQKCRQVQSKGRRKKGQLHYKDCICAFDIETTRVPDIEQSVMYVWQFQVDEYGTVFGRTWEEYIHLLELIRGVLKDNEAICVYVHNLSYEFQFLAGVYNFDCTEVFAVESRKILKCSMFNKQIEYRCSYLQTNMSLNEFTKKMGVKHGKLSGEDFDYSKVRYSWTKLTDQELSYCQNDVLGLVEAIKAEMQRDDDTLYSIPLTSTGYVRRDAKKAMSAYNIKSQVAEAQPDLELYLALHDAFRGGDTHASRFYSGKVVDDVCSVDRSSSYPDVIVNCKFPIAPFCYLGSIDLQTFKFYMRCGRAMVLRIAMRNIRLRDKYNPVPYLAKAKCQSCQSPLMDNGRVISAEYIETCVTDIDFKIILNEYEADEVVITDAWHSRYGYLPESYRELVRHYYRNKTELKDVEGMENLYNKSKALLNALYGMMAQDPVKQTVEFVEGEFINSDVPIEQLLEDATKKAFSCYQWGVWVTAHARAALRKAIHNAGHYFVYCDTDSVKYVNTPSITWSGLNKSIRKTSEFNKAYATDPKGITHYMGVWETEDPYKSFKTMGAKKYVYVPYDSDNVHCTIAGVGKKLGAKELDRAGGIEAFKEGFIFSDAGGLESVYNDEPYGEYIVEGHTINITRNVSLKPSTYTVGLTADYARLLSDNKIIKLFMEELKMANYNRNRASKTEDKTPKAPELRVTDCRVYTTERDDIVANCSVTFNDLLVVTGIKLINGKRGLFASMPQYKAKDGEYKDMVFPLSKELRAEITNVLVQEFEDLDNEQ